MITRPDLVKIALIALIALKFASACTLFESVAYWSGQIPFYTRTYHPFSLCTRVFSILGLWIIEQWQFFGADDYMACVRASRAYSAKISVRDVRILYKFRSVQGKGLLTLASSGIPVCAQEFLEFYVFKHMNRKLLMRVIFPARKSRIGIKIAFCTIFQRYIWNC